MASSTPLSSSATPLTVSMTSGSAVESANDSAKNQPKLTHHAVPAVPRGGMNKEFNQAASSESGYASGGGPKRGDSSESSSDAFTIGVPPSSHDGVRSGTPASPAVGSESSGASTVHMEDQFEAETLLWENAAKKHESAPRRRRHGQ